MVFLFALFLSTAPPQLPPPAMADLHDENGTSITIACVRDADATDNGHICNVVWSRVTMDFTNEAHALANALLRLGFLDPVRFAAACADPTNPKTAEDAARLPFSFAELCREPTEAHLSALTKRAGIPEGREVCHVHTSTDVLRFVPGVAAGTWVAVEGRKYACRETKQYVLQVGDILNTIELTTTFPPPPARRSDCLPAGSTTQRFKSRITLKPLARPCRFVSTSAEPWLPGTPR